MTQRTLSYFAVLHDVSAIQCQFHNIMTGPIAIQIDDAIFPDPGWDDFLARTLTSWVNRARIVLEHGSAETFIFMDGDPLFKVSVFSPALLTVVCYESAGLRGNGPSGTVDAIEFGEAILKAARVAENWARRNQCETQHIHALTDGISALRDELRQRDPAP